jgi:hypothetical protein
MTDNENKPTVETEYMAIGTPVLQLMNKLVSFYQPATIASVFMMEGAKLLRRLFKTDAYFKLLDSIFEECRKLKPEEDPTEE